MPASDSRCDEERQRHRLRVDLTVFEAVRKDAESQRLDGPQRMIPSFPIGHDTRQARDLRDPATVIFAIKLYNEFHSAILHRFRWSGKPDPDWVGGIPNSEFRIPKSEFGGSYSPTSLLYSQAKMKPPIAPSTNPQMAPITAPT
jgi:hypothetical protein